MRGMGLIGQHAKISELNPSLHIPPRVKKALSAMLITVSFLYLASQIGPGLKQLDWKQLARNPWPLMIALTLQLFALLSQFWVWFFLLRSQSGGFQAKTCYRQYTLSLLSRYLPAGRVAQAASLALLSRNPGDRPLALAAMFATSVITEFVEAARATLREHWTVAPVVQVQFAPVAEVTVRPVGMMSCIVIVPVVGPLPPLLTVMS